MSKDYTLSLSLNVPREDGRYSDSKSIVETSGTATDLLPWARTLLATLERLSEAEGVSESGFFILNRRCDFVYSQGQRCQTRGGTEYFVELAQRLCAMHRPPSAGEKL